MASNKNNSLRMALVLTLSCYLTSVRCAAAGTRPGQAITSCHPENLKNLPLRIQNICLSLFKQMQVFEDELEGELNMGSDTSFLSTSPEMILYEAEAKRNKDPGHVFLRFGRG